jgi:hypothetical protein
MAEAVVDGNTEVMAALRFCASALPAPRRIR